MNKVSLNIKEKEKLQEDELHLGSIWKEPYEQNYILIGTGNGFLAASLEAGNTWNGLKKTKLEAVKGLTLLFDSAKILIESNEN